MNLITDKLFKIESNPYNECRFGRGFGICKSKIKKKGFLDEQKRERENNKERQV